MEITLIIPLGLGCSSSPLEIPVVAAAADGSNSTLSSVDLTDICLVPLRNAM